MTSGEQLAADEAAIDVPAPPRPVVDVDTAGYWAAAGRGEFVLCRCTDCRHWLQPPMERCRHCGGDTAFEPATGTGSVHSFIVVRHPSVPAFARLLPYAIVLVDLAEGVRMTGRFLGEPADVRLGLPVTVGFERLPRAEQSAVVFAAAGPGT